MKQKFSALTGLRAIAAIMIFVYHNRKFWRNTFPDYINRFLNEWHIGVTIFFVLSGFLIAYNYYEKTIELNRSAYWQYVRTRLARIYPVYLLIIVAKYCFTTAPGSLEIFLNISLLKGYFSSFVLSGIPQSWSLTVELTFYALAPVLFWIIHRYGIIQCFTALLIFSLFCIGVGFSLDYLNLNTKGFFNDPLTITISTFQGRFFEFLLGVLLALHLKEIKNFKLFRIKHATLIGSTGIVLCIIAMIPLQKEIWTHGFENPFGLAINHLLLPVFISILLLGLATEKTWLSKILQTKLMIQMGYASFIFYLIHINFVNSVLWNIYAFPDRNFMLLWVVAWLAYHAIEKPAYEYLKSKPSTTS